ncbi:MAG: EAL domain-containing protein [Firmicutes bacterium]|nr:EAL domain-containing protein [Bacillota bacterium]
MSIRILVADDSVSDRLIVKNALSDYCVLTAGDGLEAMRVLKEDEGINLLILDLDVPNMNGFQVLEVLKKDERFRELRTIILTDNEELDNEIKGLKLGAVDYIRKPIHMASLKARIDLHVALLRAQQALEREHKAIEKALHESERSKSVFLSHLPGLAYRCKYDPDWTMQYVSEGCFNLTGYPPESLLYNRDLSYNDLISPEYREALWNEWKRILPAKQPFKYEYEIITATGERKWVLELGQGIYNKQGEIEALEGIILDISDRKAIENALKFNNEHDRWTGLYNRDYLVSLLEKEIKIRKNSRKALFGINLNMVQFVTANYGFQYAQNLIKKAAEALRQHCADNRLLFHARENRFVFYLFDYKDKNELVAFSNLLVKTLESLFVTDRIGGGIGIVEIGQDENEGDIDLLLRRLLIASERSVSSFGKDFDICFYDQKLEALVNREIEIVEALHAIAADEQTNDHLFLQYQPILNLKTGLICSFEALARLRTEKLGLVSPAEFIPIAEKTKLILAIGEKVITKAFRFLNTLKKNGYDQIGVSINISVIQLLNPAFVSRLLELIKEMQVNPENIGIEITESVFTSDFEKINNVIAKLRAAGLHVAIDDFGTGYSSLAREKELAVDCMKIDKHFIDELLSTELSKAITSDIISISHKLGHCTVAEGVEHEIQLQYLKEHGCDQIQGYLISKPLDEEKAIDFLKRTTQYGGQVQDLGLL